MKLSLQRSAAWLAVVVDTWLAPSLLHTSDSDGATSEPSVGHIFGLIYSLAPRFTGIYEQKYCGYGTGRAYKRNKG